MMKSCHIVQPLPRGSIQHQHHRLPHLLFLLFLYSLTSCSSGITAPTKKESGVPLLGAIPDTPFRCLGHTAGYYADPDTGCQVYHMCDSLERQYSYLCPNYTLFNQKFMVCDHWHMVNCSSSRTFYHLNSHIGEEPSESEGEEEQNVITAELKDEETHNRMPSLDPVLSSPGLVSAEPLRLQSSLRQSIKQPAKATVRGTPTKPTTLSPTTISTTSTVKPSTSFRRQWNTPQPNAPTRKQQSTTKLQQPFSSPFRQLTISPRQPFTSLTRQLTTSTIQPITPTTSKPVTFSTQKSVTQQPIPFFNSFNTKISDTTPHLRRPSSSLLTIPKIEFSHHNTKETENISQEKNIEHSSTHRPSINSSLSFTNQLTPSTAAYTREGQESDLPVQTGQPSTSFTMIPGSVARNPGNRFSFHSQKKEKFALTPEELQRIVFQPLLARPRTKTRRVLTSAPSLLPTDPINSSNPHHHHFPMRIEFPDTVIPEDSSSRGLLDFKLLNSHGTHTPISPLQISSVSAAVHPLSSFLIPPADPFTPITPMKQESPTPLTIPQRNHHNFRTPPRDTFLPGAQLLPFPTSTRGNRDFFIPSAEISLLVSNLPQNIIEKPNHDSSHSVSDQHHHHHKDHMTMVFPTPIEPSMMEELKLNPECPRCHPVFLKPGQCHPCVVIK